MWSRAHTCQQDPLLYLFLPSHPLVLCPILTSSPSLHPIPFQQSSPAFRDFIFLHLLFPFRDPFSPFNIAFLALLPPDPLLSCSSSPVFVTWVSSTRSSYIPEMPVTYGPHSSWSAVRPRTFCCRPCRHQHRCGERYRNASPLIIITVPAALQIKILN